MELNISEPDAEIIGFNSDIKTRIVGLVHQHLGMASVADVEVVNDPSGVRIETARGSVLVDRHLKQRIGS